MKSFSATTETERTVTAMAEYIAREKILSKAAPVAGCFSNMISAYDVIMLPAADVAPVRHGRWEPYFEEVEIYNAGGVAERKQTGWICGRCKSVESITRHYKTNYCPNCGAKME